MTATRRRPADKESETAGLIKLADAIDEDDPDYQAFLRRWGTRYSPRNLQLLWVQCPHATSLHTYNTWMQAGLQVRKGEKAIKLFVPKRTKIDPEKITEKNPDGKVITNVSWISLFDISQCDLIEPVATDDPDLLAELKRLRMEAANKHPDRGGTAEEFMTAWARYEVAKKKANDGRAA